MLRELRIRKRINCNCLFVTVRRTLYVTVCPLQQSALETESGSAGEIILFILWKTMSNYLVHITRMDHTPMLINSRLIFDRT